MQDNKAETNIPKSAYPVGFAIIWLYPKTHSVITAIQARICQGTAWFSIALESRDPKYDNASQRPGVDLTMEV